MKLYNPSQEKIHQRYLVTDETFRQFWILPNVLLLYNYQYPNGVISKVSLWLEKQEYGVTIIFVVRCFS